MGAEKRVEELLATAQGLVSASSDSAPQIRADLERLQALVASHGNDRIEQQSL